MMVKYTFLYLTTNNLNGKYYIGVHKTSNINDNYLGSGLYILKALQKYGRENFTREILMLCDSLEEAYEIEALLVDEYFIKTNKKECYNLSPGGKGGNFVTKEYRDKLSKRMTGSGNPHWDGGKDRLPLCLDCNKRLSTIYAKRCNSCTRSILNKERIGIKYGPRQTN